MVKPRTHVHPFHPCGPRGTGQRTLVSSPEPYGGRKEQFSQGMKFCPQKRGRGTGQTQGTAIYRGVLGAEWNVPHIHSSHSYPFPLMIWPLQQVSDHTQLVLQRELLCGRKG